MEKINLFIISIFLLAVALVSFIAPVMTNLSRRSTKIFNVVGTVNTVIGLFLVMRTLGIILVIGRAVIAILIPLILIKIFLYLSRKKEILEKNFYFLGDILIFSIFTLYLMPFCAIIDLISFFLFGVNFGFKIYFICLILLFCILIVFKMILDPIHEYYKDQVLKTFEESNLYKLFDKEDDKPKTE